MTIFKDRAQETSSNTPTDTGTVSITLAGATQYNRTFAASGYVTTDDVLVHVYQTNNPDLWCVVPGQFVDTPDRITFTDTDVEDGSSGPGVCPTWTSTVTVGVEMVASLAASASNAEPAGTAAAAITAHDTTSAHAGIVAAQTTAATSKATPVDADEIPLADSAASFALKKLTWANLKATVQSALDALYKLLPSGTSGQTLYHNGTQWVTSNTASLSFDGTTLRPKEIETTGTGGHFATKNGTNYAAVMYGQNNYLSMNASYYAAWSSGGNAIAGHDTYLWRSGVGTLGVRNALGVYPTYTDASNYERLTLTGTAGSNVQIKAETAGTGGDNLDVRITPAGTGRVFVGLDAGPNSTGSATTAMGNNAGKALTSGNYNTLYGYNAGTALTTGGQNTAIGYNAGSAITTNSYLTALGTNAAQSATGGYCVAVGHQAAKSATSGTNWLAIGYNAAYSVTTAGSFVAIGPQAGYSAQTNGNWFALGNGAGYNNTSGTHWVAIGENAARYLADGSTPATSFSQSFYLGTSTKVSADGVTNETAIGYGTTGSGSNTVTIGNTSVTRNYFSGAVGSKELSADPSDPAEGNWTMWMSDGTGAGDDGDIMIKITAGGVTKTATLIDFSTL